MVIPYELQKAIKEDSLVIFAGAGTSIPLGLPSWEGLVLEVLEEIKKHDDTYEHLEKLVKKEIITPLQVLELLKSNNHYLRIINKTLKRELKKIKTAKNFDLQLKILELSKKIITTNYDEAFESIEQHLNVILKDEKLHLAKVFGNNEFLWKIHGDVMKARECVLFENQYKKLYNKESAFLLGIKALFVQKTILFVGFSLADPYIEEIIKAIDELYEAHLRKPLVITTKGKFIENKYGKSIKCIPIRDNSELGNILDELIKFKKDPNSYISEISKIVRPSNTLIGRKKQLEDIMDKITEAFPITVIQGPPGIGKTALANEIALLCLGKSEILIEEKKIVKFDLVVWITLDIYISEGNLMNIIFDEIGRQTDHKNVIQTSKLEEKRMQVRDLLNDNKILIVLDNFEVDDSEELNNWIRTIKAPSEILITTRHDPRFSQASYILRGLNEEDSIEFMRIEAKSIEHPLGKWDSNEVLKKIHVATGGNPQSMKIAVGYIKQGELQLQDLNQTPVKIKTHFEEAYAKCWKKLSKEAKKILLLFTVFPANNLIHRDALMFISELDDNVFKLALTDLFDWNLFNVAIKDQNYSIHPSLLEFLKIIREGSIRRSSLVQDAHVKHLFIKFYLQFLQNTVVRKSPNEVYWNTLVCDNMIYIEPHMFSIFQAINWAKEIPSEKENFVEFVMLLVHYMDSRFYNKERLELVKEAVTICHTLPLKFKYYEAIFLIDSLGWTFVEEDKLDEAYDCITKGMEIIKENLFDESNTNDLSALATAWLARVKIEQGFASEAIALIEIVKDYNGKPWINSRIYQAVGDVNYKQEKYDDALKYYKLAKEENNMYGGEGNDYRMNPRIGLAYLSIKKIDEAKEIFKLVKDNSYIYINKLYGEYGLALVEFEEEISNKKTKNVKPAIEKLKGIEEEILKRSKSNILLKLINEYRSKHFIN